ncbi:MAG: Ig-like domain-containing protein [Acidobacteria bacterium]|nr:Ig-like domain-containing protein [Acidobacteriota bacterium]
MPIDAKISVTFDEAMNLTSVQDAFLISPSTPGTFSWNNNTMFFTPSSDMIYNTTCRITIGMEAKDLAMRTGNRPRCKGENRK